MKETYHPKLKRRMVIIQPGEYFVTDQDLVIATVLGSCISVCIHDEEKQIGGMNHFMLPGDFSDINAFADQSARYGMYAMEMILGDLIKLGSSRNRLSAKVFGGGHLLNSIQVSEDAVPAANIRFVKAFLSMEGIRVSKSDVGGRHGRKVLYLPHSGRAFIRSLVSDDDNKLASRDKHYQSKLAREVKKEDVTIF